MATSLTIKVLADVSKAVSGLDQVDQKAQGFGSKMAGLAGIIGGAFSTQKIVGMLEDWTQAGLTANGAIKNTKYVFDDAASSVMNWADTTAASFGMTASEAESAAAKVGVALVGYGLSHKDAAKQAEDLVNRSADIAKVLGVNEEDVLSRVQSAMRGRTAGIKDYGVQVATGSSETDIFNAFMDQTKDYAGRSDTALGNLHGTFGDLKETLGQALVPILMDLLPLIQGLADWAKNNKGAFQAIVLTFTAMALIMGIAATVAGILAVAEWSVLWPVLLVVAAIVALVAIVVLLVLNWSTLVGWFHEGVNALAGVIDKVGAFIAKFTGPAWGGVQKALEWLKGIWHDISGAIDGVLGVVGKLWDKLEAIGGKIGGILSKIPGVNAAGATAAGPSATAFGVVPMAAPVFAPTINISGDIGDPMLAGRRIVAALETWTAANGRRRMSALVGGP